MLHDGPIRPTRHHEFHAANPAHFCQAHARETRCRLDNFENSSRRFGSRPRHHSKRIRIGGRKRKSKLPGVAAPESRNHDGRAPGASCLIFPAIVGFFIITVVLWDAFETIILPRRVARWFRLTRMFYLVHVDSLEGSRSKDSFPENSRVFYQLLWPAFALVPVRSLGRSADFWVCFHVLRRGRSHRHHPAQLQHPPLHERNNFLHPRLGRRSSPHCR